MTWQTLFHEILQDFKHFYSYLGFKHVTVEELERRYAPVIRNVSDEQAFIQELTEALSEFCDPHIDVFDSRGQRHTTHTPLSRRNHKYRVTIRMLSRILFKNKAGIVGFLNDTLYVAILSWNNRIRSDLDRLFEVIEQTFRTRVFTKQLIIDVRSNVGGDDRHAMRVLSYLIHAPLAVSRYAYRVDPDDPRRLKWGPCRVVSPNTDVRFAGQVVALIGNECMSSTEFFVLGLKAIGKPRVTLIGDHTYGSSGNPRVFSKGRIKYRIPSWVSYSARGELLEGRGVMPDIKIPPESTIRWGRDRALQTARRVLSR